MSKKDYLIISDFCRNTKPVTVNNEVNSNTSWGFQVELLCERLKLDNPKFNEEKLILSLVLSKTCFLLPLPFRVVDSFKISQME